ncbi:hypothetical protein CVS47_00769 [Microbacterium lemovicicum]|uniref:Uncharacterized protein n=1 Tax=Microbacterium lemovicicum TaxID=1072463 RepID=A0A3S9W825_9MICO|nr:hypothetical protein CVS47_00769 [Microbacterium lemovicicum]
MQDAGPPVPAASVIVHVSAFVRVSAIVHVSAFMRIPGAGDNRRGLPGGYLCGD